MTIRFSHLLRGRAPRRSGGASCRACGQDLLADGHAIQLAGGAYHAGCVLYRRRPLPDGAAPVEARLRATR